MRLGETGLVATEIMPGIDAQRDIASVSGGRVEIAENAELMSDRLLSSGPMGLTL
jgi:acyl CoA:acetate/3-ketoacid CoA transferase